MTSRFMLDKANARMMGVCSGLAGLTGLDVTIVRVLTVLSLFLLGPVTILLYLVAGLIAPDRV
ncbi:PspC domain-containing protein [Sphingosinicella rhizophila]|uniref:PspC domain-containing protein n=1 Tax=Sphingosinicella rhizophila TaxID=3050082 RepID=A0ABU3Q895_9SPHN|nr:PspC domain-containing protein [Sphingosinicella sp. GR2756]MDT9599624.1 PspC domain-containing protein [Sphingosinicella sp. GR2756]